MKKFDKVMEWVSTAILLVGVVLTSFNIFPLNVWFSLAGNVCWIIVGIMWRKYSLIVVSTVISVLYLIGLVKEYFYAS
jgi:hypothetical protein